MKYFLSICLSLASLFIYAQSLEVVEAIHVNGRIGEELETVISIRNTGDKPVQVVIKRISQNLGTSQKSWFCWDNECYEPEQTSLPLSRKIEPGQTIEAFRTLISTGITEGFSNIKYLIYDKNNPGNETIVEVNYRIEDYINSSALFHNSKLTINDVYPNPVKDFATVDYKISDLDLKVRIVIHSVLGKVMDEYDLEPFETKIKIQTDRYNPGIYFYTIYIDNDGVLTRKLIVQK